MYKGNIMNKKELIEAVSLHSGLSRVDSAKSVEAFMNSVSETLQSGEDVKLVGFGTFTLMKRKATTGRNPRTGEEIHIKASKYPKFKAGVALKEAVN